MTDGRHELRAARTDRRRDRRQRRHRTRDRPARPRRGRRRHPHRPRSGPPRATPPTEVDAPSSARPSTPPTSTRLEQLLRRSCRAPIDHVLVTGRRSVLRAAGRLRPRRGAPRRRRAPPADRCRSPGTRRGTVRPGGTLLFMSGTGGRRTGAGLRAHLGAHRRAARRWSANLALELAPIRVNLIAAGFVDTPLSASLLGDELDARREQLRATLPIGRVVGAGRRRRARRPPHDEHRRHRRDLRHRRRPAARRAPDPTERGLRPCAPTSHPAARSPTTSCPTTPSTARTAQRAPGRRSDDPHARARPLLPEGAPAAPRARRVPAEDRGGLHADRHDLDRRAPRAAGVPRVGRRPVDRSSPTRGGSSSRTSTSRSTPTPTTTR